MERPSRSGRTYLETGRIRHTSDVGIPNPIRVPGEVHVDGLRERCSSARLDPERWASSSTHWIREFPDLSEARLRPTDDNSAPVISPGNDDPSLDQADVNEGGEGASLRLDRLHCAQRSSNETTTPESPAIDPDETGLIIRGQDEEVGGNLRDVQCESRRGCRSNRSVQVV